MWKVATPQTDNTRLVLNPSAPESSDPRLRLAKVEPKSICQTFMACLNHPVSKSRESMMLVMLKELIWFREMASGQRVVILREHRIETLLLLSHWHQCCPAVRSCTSHDSQGRGTLQQPLNLAVSSQ